MRQITPDRLVRKFVETLADEPELVESFLVWLLEFSANPALESVRVPGSGDYVRWVGDTNIVVTFALPTDYFVIMLKSIDRVDLLPFRQD